MITQTNFIFTKTSYLFAKINIIKGMNNGTGSGTSDQD